MELKEYQGRVITRFEGYLAALARAREAVPEKYMAREAWDDPKVKGVLPRVQAGRDGPLIVPPYVERRDAAGRSIPHVCLKVPTGGGKTLLAAECVGRVQTDFLRRQVGLVLWVMPSCQIFDQTDKALRDRTHPYRQVLERASGGRVKIVYKDDALCRADVDNYLCVMLVRLAATNRNKSKEFLRIFRDAGRYRSFFPPVDDYLENNALLQAHGDLERHDLADAGAIPNVSVKQSLVNVLKMVRPVVVIDEGHKAYSENTREALNGFNPSFVLELTATPNVKARVSNILVDVLGTDLKDAQMIKLPIHISALNKGDWQGTLDRAHGKLADLEAAAREVEAAEGRYIRPIMVVRVERTGKDQRDGKRVHAEDAKAYLIERLCARPEEIRIKSAEDDGLRDTDLLSPLCPVRYVITKSALQEGWDCPFAYVLALLDNTTAGTAMTQMVGRVLRQPHARATGCEALNACYVFCHNQKVGDAIDAVKKGLEGEGMADLGAFVQADSSGADGQAGQAPKRKLGRNPRFKGLEIFLPRVLHADGTGGWRAVEYGHDILAAVPWSDLTYDPVPFLAGGLVERTKSLTFTRDKDRQGVLWDESAPVSVALEGGAVDVAGLCAPLSDIVPNPWQAARIWGEALARLRAEGKSEGELYAMRLDLLNDMKGKIKAVVHERAEAIFREKLARGTLRFHLTTAPYGHLNFKLLQEIEIRARPDDPKIRREDGDLPQNTLYGAVYEADVNGLERKLAMYLANKDEAVTWWHKMAERSTGAYALQGWKKDKVYPDFLVCLHGGRVVVLETKGNQLENPDTAYKRALFDLLTQSAGAAPVGTMEIDTPQGPCYSFEMVMEDDWRARMDSLLTEREAA
ncbi:MAG TPA: restriction endonuclease subunit R [Rhodospirillaceae bacterium]|jgi:type III restriction enzyme|nr:DEAD/DEAH box helicase family protein [Alphaproteobacteria bacterium]HBH26975.1 restriction endonuclease subunit R [Rhodospirillaceae bacterium]